MYIFKTNLDLDKNEIKQFKVENGLALPSLTASDGGYLFYHSGLKKFYGWDESSWLDLGAGANNGDVIKVGTPVNNQLAVWTGDGTLEGDTNLTFDSVSNILNYAGSVFEINGEGGLVLNGGFDSVYVKGTGSAFVADLNTSLLTAARVFNFPDQGGTFALTSDISGYAELAGNNNFTGINIFETFAPRIEKGLNFLPSSIAVTTGHAGFGLWSNNNWAFTKVDTTLRAEFDISNITTSSKTYTFPDKNGTIALLDDVNSITPVTFTPTGSGGLTFTESYYIDYGTHLEMVINGTWTASLPGSGTATLNLPASKTIRNLVLNKVVGSSVGSAQTNITPGAVIVKHGVPTTSLSIQYNQTFNGSATYTFSANVLIEIN